jgi:hypothetical protein
LNDRWFYFRPLDAKIVNRPREVFDILTDRDSHPASFTPAAEPTFPVTVPRRPIDVREYQVLNTLRPWWISQRRLDVAERPVDLKVALKTLVGLALVGLTLMAIGLGFRVPQIAVTRRALSGA